MAAQQNNSRIEDYAMIGDCRTAALVSRDGSIDWLCLPRFDSDACFAALLGDSTHGRWQIKPNAKASITRRYIDGSLILETEFKTRAGVVRVTDFMPVSVADHDKTVHSSVIRIVTGITGHVAMQMELVLRFDYGLTVPWFSKQSADTYTGIAGSQMVTLRTKAPLQGSKDLRTMSNFTVGPGQTMTFVLTNSQSYKPLPPPLNVNKLLATTTRDWRKWSSRCIDVGPYTEYVRRSLILLKGLTYVPTGGIVAALTTSLPEEIGGGRNWDYRYCWIRDATFTLLAFMNAGYTEEAAAWRDWLLRAVAGSPQQLQIMYGIAGERRLDEWEIPWLPGYEKSAPVRVGNAASTQIQLDVFGEMMDALVQAAVGGVPRNPHAGKTVRLMLEHLETIWRKPDNGIWEIRGPLQHFVHSKAMAWLAFNRMANNPLLQDDRVRGHYRHIARTIHADICKHGVHPEGNYFTQYYGTDQVDASLLLLAIVGFLPPDDIRIKNTVERIEAQLMPAGFVLRYKSATHVDGLSGTEAAFLACSFWLVDNYVLLGRLEDATTLFEKLCRLTNDVGMLSEEYDPQQKRMLGNVPQAFSHVALVNSAIGLEHARRLLEQRPLAKHPKGLTHTIYRHAFGERDGDTRTPPLTTEGKSKKPPVKPASRPKRKKPAS